MSGTTAASPLEATLKRDRAVVLSALVLVIVLSWGWVLAGAGMGMSALEMTRMTLVPAGLDRGGDMEMTTGTGADMTGSATDQTDMAGTTGTTDPAGMSGMAEMAGMAMQPAAWDADYAVLMFFMWWIMMIAMMLPSASPMILLYAAVNRRRVQERTHLRTAIFTLGYLMVWAAFSAIATGAQWGLERTGLVSSMMASTSAVLGGGLLLAAGLWQLTPIKQACLRHCQSPLFFIAHHWRPGSTGALRMGLGHGVYCTGCCWFLMALLFVGGVMNLLWIGGLALFVLFEKIVPPGHWLTRASGIALVLAGAGLFAAAAV